MGNCNQCMGTAQTQRKKKQGKKGGKDIKNSAAQSSVDIAHFSVMSISQKVKKIGERYDEFVMRFNYAVLKTDIQGLLMRTRFLKQMTYPP